MITLEEKIRELKDFFKQKSLTQKKVAEITGMTQPQVSQLLSGKDPIGKKTAKLWSDHFGLSYTWLLTGEGVMMKDITIPASAISSEPSPNAVPIYDIDFNAGFVERYGGNELERVGVIDSPAYSKATAVVSVTGDSMHPLISSGDQIIIREMPCTMDSIMFGKIYAVVTDNDLRTVKRIRKSSVQGCIDLEPINKEVADTTTIAFDRIISLWQVMGCIKPLN